MAGSKVSHIANAIASAAVTPNTPGVITAGVTPAGVTPAEGSQGVAAAGRLAVSAGPGCRRWPQPGFPARTPLDSPRAARRT